MTVLHRSLSVIFEGRSGRTQASRKFTYLDHEYFQNLVLVKSFSSSIIESRVPSRDLIVCLTFIVIVLIRCLSVRNMFPLLEKEAVLVNWL